MMLIGLLASSEHRYVSVIGGIHGTETRFCPDCPDGNTHCWENLPAARAMIQWQPQLMLVVLTHEHSEWHLTFDDGSDTIIDCT